MAQALSRAAQAPNAVRHFQGKETLCMLMWLSLLLILVFSRLALPKLAHAIHEDGLTLSRATRFFHTLYKRALTAASCPTNSRTTAPASSTSFWGAFFSRRFSTTANASPGCEATAHLTTMCSALSLNNHNGVSRVTKSLCRAAAKVQASKSLSREHASSQLVSAANQK